MRNKYSSSDIILLILSVVLLILGIVTIILLFTTTNMINKNQNTENSVVENG